MSRATQPRNTREHDEVVQLAEEVAEVPLSLMGSAPLKGQYSDPRGGMSPLRRSTGHEWRYPANCSWARTQRLIDFIHVTDCRNR